MSLQTGLLLKLELKYFIMFYLVGPLYLRKTKQKEVEQLFVKQSVRQKWFNKRINPFGNFVQKRATIRLKSFKVNKNL